MNSSSAKLIGLPRAQAIAWCAAFLLEAVVIILGNAITIAIFSTRKQKKQRSYLLMINLAVADVLIGALPLPLYVYHAGGHPFQLWTISITTENQVLGIIFNGLDIFLGFASLLTLTAISIERFYASSFPVKYKGVQLNAYTSTIVSIWGVALVTATTCVTCAYLLSYNVATYVSMSLISVLCLIICVSYIQIWVGLKKRRQQLRQKSTDSDSKLAITLLIVTFSSLAAWLPFVIVNFCFVVSPFDLKEELLLLSKLLHYGNSVFNPIVYSFRVPGFRKSAKRLLSLSSPHEHSRNSRKNAAPASDINASADVSHSPSFSLRAL